MIEDIIAISLDDGTRFEVKSVESIMDEAEYSGIRFKLDALLDTMKTPLKIDISTDDVITPKEVNYEYKLMFEERSIPLLAYNLEEKESHMSFYQFRSIFWNRLELMPD